MPQDGTFTVNYAAEHYAKLAPLEDASFWFQARASLIIWAISHYFPHAESLLEVGCGTGYQLRQIRRELPSLRLAGSEYLVEGLAFAAPRLPGVPLFQMDARRIPFVDEFDLIGAFDVLEHIEDDNACLREFRKAVKPGGGVILTVPQHPGLWSEADELAEHVRRYRAKDLKSKVVAAGFRVRRVTSFVTLLLPGMLLSRLVRRHPSPFNELGLSAPLNAMLAAASALERRAITAGARLPVGGSLLVVAQKPA